jgi:hypothetical protein
MEAEIGKGPGSRVRGTCGYQAGLANESVLGIVFPVWDWRRMTKVYSRGIAYICRIMDVERYVGNVESIRPSIDHCEEEPTT